MLHDLPNLQQPQHKSSDPTHLLCLLLVLEASQLVVHHPLSPEDALVAVAPHRQVLCDVAPLQEVVVSQLEGIANGRGNGPGLGDQCVGQHQVRTRC